MPKKGFQILDGELRHFLANSVINRPAGDPGKRRPGSTEFGGARHGPFVNVAATERQAGSLKRPNARFS
jgi:hypothetical protein